MKRTRAQNPKLQDPVAAAANPKPQRKAKLPRQPKAGGKKALAAAAAREAAAAAASAPAAPSALAEMAPVVPDVCGAGVGGGGGHVAVAGGLPADWDEMDGAGNGSPWWTFGVEEEMLLGWFPFVEEDFSGWHGHGGGNRIWAVEPEPAAFDDDIWRIHQIYEIPSYAAK